MSDKCQKCNDTGWYFPYPEQILRDCDFVARFPCECGQGDVQERALFEMLVRPMIPLSNELTTALSRITRTMKS